MQIQKPGKTQVLLRKIIKAKNKGRTRKTTQYYISLPRFVAEKLGDEVYLFIREDLLDRGVIILSTHPIPLKQLEI